MLNGTGAVIHRSLSLPGGATRIDTGGTMAWFYPNQHGDVTLRADGNGDRVGARTSFDPFGQPIAANGDIGTQAADESVQDTTPGDADLAFVGGAGKLYEHGGSIAIIEMGARQYSAALGRFLEVDPVEGGVSNNYDYPADPINQLDLSGMKATVESGGCGTIKNLENTRCRAAHATATQIRKGLIPQMGPTSSNTIPAPRDCSKKSCKFGDFNLNICAVGCIAVGISVREDGAVYGSAGVGGGLKADATFDVGGSTGTGNGSSQTVDWSCSAAAFYGYYAGGSVSVADQWADGFTAPLTHDWASGGQVGVGAGCSAMLVATVPLWGE